MRAFLTRAVAVATFVVVTVLFGGWLWAALAPEEGVAARAAMVSDLAVTVSTDGFLSFDPGDATTGLVIYPGGRVRPEAYAPVARMVAEAGYLVVVPDMPFHLAVLAPSRADRVMARYPSVETWVIAGHSLGGAMAASFAELSDDVAGLVMWAAYPANSVDLSGRSDLVSTGLVGTLDRVIDAEALAGSVARMPPGYEVLRIEGGNHAQFGDYGAQAGDGEPAIGAREQWSITANATIAVLDRVGSR